MLWILLILTIIGVLGSTMMLSTLWVEISSKDRCKALIKRYSIRLGIFTILAILGFLGVVAIIIR